MTIEAINLLTRGDFVEALGWVFEHSPWVADRAWERRPFATVESLEFRDHESSWRMWVGSQ